MTIAWQSGPVPPQWRGLWRRLALERADGSTDTASFVLWIQTESAFVDLRIPPDRSGVEGFAGELQHAGDCARWLRTIDFAPTGQPDEGRLSLTRRMMTEHGLHEPYTEWWWREATDAPQTLAHTADHIAVRARDDLLFANRQPNSCEVSHARLTGDGWRIANSTLPCREGAILTAQNLQPTASD